MRDFDEHNITEAVLERVSAAENPRVRQISEALVRRLHAFIRDVEPTFDEWLYCIDFLTRVGAKCDANRQEFVLLSDTLGASMLIDAINHRLPQGATETTVLGPFYVAGAPEVELGANIAEGMPGEPLFVEGRVTSETGAPLPGAIVDVWHSDSDGFYDVQRYAAGGPTTMRARLRCDAEGRFRLWTILPSCYPIPDDGPVGEMLRAQGRHPYRPAHVHFMIDAPGREKLVTHVFVDGDKYLDSDAVFGVKNSLIKTFEHRPAGAPAGGAAPSRDYYALAYDFALAPASQ